MCNKYITYGLFCQYLYNEGRMNIEKALMDETKKWAITNGADYMRLSVIPKNTKGIKFYKNYGLSEHKGIFFTCTIKLPVLISYIQILCPFGRGIKPSHAAVFFPFKAFHKIPCRIRVYASACGGPAAMALHLLYRHNLSLKYLPVQD